MKLLIADDDPTQILILEALAKSWGYEILAVDNGLKALEILRSTNAPGVAVMDWMLTGMDGIDVIRAVRNEHPPQGFAAPYLILLTSRDSQEDVVHGLNTGADDYLKKPVNPLELRARLDVGRRVQQLQQCLAQRVGELEAEVSQRIKAQAENLRLSTAIDQASDGIVIADVNGVIEYVNESFVRSTGYERERVIGCNPRLLKSSDHDTSFYEEIWKTISAGEIWRGEITDRRRDGTTYTEEMSITPTRDSRGQLAKFIAIKKDVTARKAVEADLAREQYYMRKLMDSVPDMIYFKDKSSRFVRINKAMAQRLGAADPTAPIGKTDRDYFSEEHAAEAYDDEQNIIATGQAIISKEEKETWPDGRITWVTSSKMPLQGPAGEIAGTFGISRDITQRKLAEDELRQSEQSFRFQSSLLHAIYDVSPEGILVVDGEGTILSHNRKFLEVWRLEAGDRSGIEDERLLGAVLNRVKNPAAFRQRVEYLYANRSIEDRCEIGLTDGRTLDRRSSALEGPNGEYLGRVWFFQDITEHKTAEAARAEESRLTVLRAEVGAALTGRTTMAAGLQQCAEALVRCTGVAFARIWSLETGGSVLTLEASAGIYTHINGGHARVPVGSLKIGRIAQSRSPHLTNDMRNDPDVADHEWAKREGLVSFVGYPLITRDEVVGVAAAFGRSPLPDATTLALRSISDQIAHFIDARRAETALQRSEEMARLLFNAVPDPAYVFDLDTLEFLEVNERALAHYGYSREEFLAMKVSDIRSAEAAERLKTYLRANPGPEYAGQSTHETKDGRTIDVEIKCHVIDYEGRRAGLTIAQDITERRKAEVDLRHAQKLEAVGRLASGITHEIDTPIQFVGDNLRFLADGFQDLHRLLKQYNDLVSSAVAEEAHCEALTAMREAVAAADLEYLLAEIPRALTQSLDGVGRVATIVKAMKDFAHPQQGQKAPANLNEALASTLVVARNELKYVANVETDFADLPAVECHLGDLNQVFLNMLINAAHAIGQVVNGTGRKGTIRVQTRQDGDWICIAISDTGCGIPEQIRGRIFDPFFTTKDVGRGTGQGLSISRSIVVDKHGGTLTFESEVGRGTTFHIGLPISRPVAESKIEILPPRIESSLQLRLVHTFDLDKLHPARGAGNDAHLGSRHAAEVGQEADAFLVGFAIYGRRREVELPRLAEAPGNGRPFRPRAHLYRETRHSTLALRLATPAATRVSTTSKAMASSSQSWLVPSAFWVATVRVYCCGVSHASRRKSTSRSSPAAKSPSFMCSIRVLVPYTSMPMRVRMRIPTMGSVTAA